MQVPPVVLVDLEQEASQAQAALPRMGPPPPPPVPPARVSIEVWGPDAMLTLLECWQVLTNRVRYLEIRANWLTDTALWLRGRAPDGDPDGRPKRARTS